MQFNVSINGCISKITSYRKIHSLQLQSKKKKKKDEFYALDEIN